MIKNEKTKVDLGRFIKLLVFTIIIFSVLIVSCGKVMDPPTAMNQS